MDTIDKLSIENVIEEINNLVWQIDNRTDEIKELINNISEYQDKTSITDIALFKEKLHLYNLDSEELLNFIDLYMKIYNK